MPKAQEAIKKALEDVNDPELNISIMDLGLVYDIKQSGKKIHLTMTLTTLGCPLFSLIEQEVKSKLKDMGYTEENIELELTFEPPWSIERMSPKGKAMLGI